MPTPLKTPCATTRPDPRRPARARLALAAAAGLVALTPALAAASFPAGVWGLLDKVTPGDDVNNPTLRIDGLFIVGNQLPDFPDYPGYRAPQYGYMYYHCPKGQEKVCAMEWADLAAAAGTDDNCRGWGDLSLKNNGSVRESDPMSSPDAYPIAGGVYTGFSPCEALTMWMQANPDTTTTGDSSTGDASTGDASTGDASTGDTSGTGSTGDTTGTGSTGDTSGTGSTGDTSGTGGTGDTAGTGSTGDTAGTGVTGDTTGGSGDSVGSSAGEASTGASASGGGDTDKDSGCACRSDGDAGSVGLFSALLGLGLLGGRRRRA